MIHRFPLRKNSKPFLRELSTTNLFKKKLTAYYSLDKYFNKEITINWDFDTSNKKKHISNRGSIIILTLNSLYINQLNGTRFNWIEIFRNSEKNEHYYMSHIIKKKTVMSPNNFRFFFFRVSLIIITQSFLKVHYLSTLSL